MHERHRSYTSNLAACRRSLKGCAFRTCVIAGSRTYLELVVALGVGFHFDGAITALGLRSRGFIADGVLVTYVVSHFLSNGVHLTQVLGEERHSSRIFRHSG